MIVKLHSDFKLDGVGEDFVFACQRKKKKNPHLASTGRNGPTLLKFGGCLVGILRVSGGCLEGV